MIFVGAIYIATASFVQSNYFGKIVSEQIARILEENTEFEISFQNVRISLLPLETQIYGVNISQKTSDKKFEAQIGSVAVELGIWSLLTNDIVVEMLELDGAEIILSRNTTEIQAKEKWDIEEIHSLMDGLVDRVHSSLPVKLENIRLKRSYLYLDQISTFINKVDIQIYDSFIAVDAQLEQFSIKDKYDYFDEIDPDSIEIAIEISNEDINVRRLQIWSNLDYLAIEGRYKYISNDYNFSLKYEGELGRASPILEQEFNEWISGYAKVTSHIVGSGSEVEGEIFLEGHNVKSNFAILEDIELGATVKDSLLVLSNLKASLPSGSVTLESPVKIMNIQTKEFEPDESSFQLKDVDSKSAFYFLRDEFKSVHGTLNGQVKLSYSTLSRSVYIVAGEPFEVTGFRLDGGDNLNILENEFMNLTNCIVEIHRDATVSIQATIKTGESLIRAGGFIGRGEIEITAISENLSIEDLGPIAGLDARGKGSLLLEIGNKLNDVNFRAILDMHDFKFLDISLNKAEGTFNYRLKTDELKIEDIKGSYGVTQLSLAGIADFSERNDYSFNFKVNDLSYQESKLIMPSVFQLFPRFIDEVETLINVSHGKLWGKFDEKNVNASGYVTTRALNWGVEDFDYLSMNFSADNGLISIGDFVLSKSGKLLKGDLRFDTNRDAVYYNFNLEPISISEFKTYQLGRLGLQGNLTGNVVGEGPLRNLEGKAELVLSQTSIDNYSVPESFIRIDQSGEMMDVVISFMEILNTNATLSLDPALTATPSKIHEFKLQTDDIRNLLGVISKNNIMDDSIEGEISVFAEDIIFSLHDLSKLSLDLNVEKFRLVKRGEAIVISPNSKLSIREGFFLAEEISSPSNSEYSISVKPTGNISEDFKIQSTFKLPARFLEIISDEVMSAKGQITGRADILGRNGSMNTFSNININQVELKLRSIEGIVENLQGSVETNNRDIKIHRLDAGYGNGKVQADGNMHLSFPVPVMKIYLDVSDAFLPVMKRSGLVLAGKFDLTGEGALPYLLKGRGSIVFGEVLEDLTDFQTQADDLRSVERFLPTTQQRQSELFELDIDLSTQRAVSVRNNMLELYLEGAGKLTGSIRAPVFEGQLSATPDSKFKFKGHEFSLSRGVIVLDRQYTRDGASLDFSGLSSIGDYRIRLDVSGRSKEMAVGLSSEPSLSQEDIFSLLTLGVTSDISDALEEGERQNVARVGLGTLLADQFKLNEGLDSSFGLRLSVLPEFAQEESSLLQGKSAVSETGTSRFRSATRVRLQKKVTERVDLSVSSTVGGSLDQKQEMNLNFRINNRWSVEGIYELRATENEGNDNTESIGADLKYRWAF